MIFGKFDATEDFTLINHMLLLGSKFYFFSSRCHKTVVPNLPVFIARTKCVYKDPNVLALNSELEKLSHWLFKANKLSLNLKMTKFMLFKPRQKRQNINLQVYINEQEIEQVKETIVLGVFLDENLSWKAHISQTNKISKSIGINSRSSFFSQKSHIKANAYKTLVRPQIEYASTIWDPFTQENQNKIEMVQRRAARFVCNNYRCKASITTMLDELGWRSLKQRRAEQRLIMLYKIVNNLVEVDLSKELIPLTRHSRMKRSPEVRASGGGLGSCSPRKCLNLEAR